MTKKIISDAITNISIEFIEKAADYTVAKKARKPVWIKWAAMAACFCMIVMAVISVVQRGDYVMDIEPQKELTVAEAMAYEPLGTLYPEVILNGYVLENNRIALYNDVVMKAVYRNDSIGDVLTITIAAMDYFGDVERNTILRYEQGGTRMYIENGDYVIAYDFSTRDIADIGDFEEMVTSAAADLEGVEYTDDGAVLHF